MTKKTSLLFTSLVTAFLLTFNSGAWAALPYPQIDPVAFSVFGFQVKWYGICYLLGLGGILLIVNRLLKKDHALNPPYNADISFDDFFNTAVNCFLLGILGGRLGYVLFYNLPFYLEHPADIIKVWQGGMSFHGGFMGGVLGVYLSSRKKKNFWQIADLGATAFPVALIFGRIANFINDELWGRQTDVSWAVLFPNGGYIPRHPSQLYEAALEGLVLLVILLFVRSYRLNKPALLSGIFIAGYGIARFIVEFFREPDAQIGYMWTYFTRGQFLSVPMILIGLGLIIWALKKPSTKSSA